MTKDAALKLALEALEGADMIDCDMREAITALKEALAQPEQKPVAAYLEVRRPNGPWQRYNLYSSVAVAEDAMRRIEGPPIEVRVLPLYTAPPKPEPEPHQCKGIPRKGCNYLTACGHVCNKCGEIHHAHMLAYVFDTPPKHEWVGLTKDDIDLVWPSPAGTNSVYIVARAIEAKLKQKNGYAEEKNT